MCRFILAVSASFVCLLGCAGVGWSQDLAVATKQKNFVVGVNPLVLGWEWNRGTVDIREMDLRLESSFGVFVYDGFEMSLILDAERSSSKGVARRAGVESVNETIVTTYGVGVQLRPYIPLKGKRAFVRPAFSLRYYWVKGFLAYYDVEPLEPDGTSIRGTIGGSIGYMMTRHFSASLGLQVSLTSLTYGGSDSSFVAVQPDVALTWMF